MASSPVLAPVDNTSANSSSPPTKRKSKAPVQIDEDAVKMQRLATLATAFRQNPNPVGPHLMKIARKTFLPPDEVEVWFSKRRVLETWVTRNQLTSATDVAAALTGVKSDINLQQVMAQVGIAEQPPPSGEQLEELPVASSAVASPVDAAQQ